MLVLGSRSWAVGSMFVVVGLLGSATVRAAPVPWPPDPIRVCSPSGAYCVVSEPGEARVTLLRQQSSDGAFTPQWSFRESCDQVAVSDDGVVVTGTTCYRRDGCDETTTILTFRRSPVEAVEIPLSRVLLWAALMPWTSGALAWVRHVGWDEHGHYVISTADFGTLAFDPATGTLMVSSRPPWSSVAFGVIMIGLAGLICCVRRET